MGAGEYGKLILPDGTFGLGFKRFSSEDGSLFGFGHSGLGGSTGFCDVRQVCHCCDREQNVIRCCDCQHRSIGLLRVEYPIARSICKICGGSKTFD